MIPPPPHRQSGLSLVELMVAFTISLILLAGVIQIFLGSRQSYRLNENMSRIQENGRFATEFLTRDFRQAGYRGGCAPGVEVNSLLNPAGACADAALFNLNTGAMGWDNAAPVDFVADMTAYVNNTDVLFINHAAVITDATASGNTPPNAATINLTGPSGVPQGAIVVVAEGNMCDMFQNRATPTASALTRGIGAGSCNLNPAGNPLSGPYTGGMSIMGFRSVLYYVGTNPVTARPGLRRVSYATGTPVDEELVDGVVDMQVLYGEDTTGDRVPNIYLTATNVGNWGNIVATRISLLLEGPDNNVTAANLTLTYNGANRVIANRRLAKVFTTTVGLRNRLP